MATNKVQTGLRLEQETLSKIAFIAKRQKRSLNAQLEFITQQCIEEYEAKFGPIRVEESD